MGLGIMNDLFSLLLGTALVLSFSTVACGGAAQGDPAEQTSSDNAALRISGSGSGGTSYDCGATNCTCSASIPDDCTGMSTYCKNNGGDGIVHCKKTECSCNLTQ